MARQEEIVKKYFKVHKNPTLEYISKDTDIQITRVFRILRGQEMKITEYERFEDSIKKVTSRGAKTTKKKVSRAPIKKKVTKKSKKKVAKKVAKKSNSRKSR